MQRLCEKSQIPPTAVGGCFQVQPTTEHRAASRYYFFPPFSSRLREKKKTGDSGLAYCRSDLNHPLTAVGGIETQSSLHPHKVSGGPPKAVDTAIGYPSLSHTLQAVLFFNDRQGAPTGRICYDH